MHSLVKGSLATLGAVALAGPAAAQFGGPPGPPNTGVPLHTQMTGGDGSGIITVVVDPPKGTACYIMNVVGLEGITAAHIHTGAAGQTGNPVVMLAAPTDGTSGGCVAITADVAQALLANPAGYYVNVHTSTFPNGAIRGQLMK
jgi:hypothetical protein